MGGPHFGLRACFSDPPFSPHEHLVHRVGPHHVPKKGVLPPSASSHCERHGTRPSRPQAQALRVMKREAEERKAEQDRLREEMAMHTEELRCPRPRVGCAACAGHARRGQRPVSSTLPSSHSRKTAPMESQSSGRPLRPPRSTRERNYPDV